MQLRRRGLYQRNSLRPILSAIILFSVAGAYGQGFAPRSTPLQPNQKKTTTQKRPAPSQTNRGFDSFNIVAVVDDEVILLEDILAGIKAELEMRKRQMPPAQYKEYEEQRIRQATQGKIQQLIVMHELKKKLPDPSIMDRIRKTAEGDFEKYMSRIVRENNLKSREELLEQLKKEGADLATLRASFIDNLLAQQYLNSLVAPKVREPSRLEMEEFYEQNGNLYAQQAGAVWRHIEIKKGTDEKASVAKITDLKAKLDAGVEFAALAKSDSQGPTAGAGGLWSRTSKGSYADPKVDAAIFSQPIGTVSPVIEGATSFHLVLVEERSNGEPKAFIDVQDDIRNRLRGKQIDKLRKELVEQLGQSHHVVTAFDEGQTKLATPVTSSPRR